MQMPSMVLHFLLMKSLLSLSTNTLGLILIAEDNGIVGCIYVLTIGELLTALELLEVLELFVPAFLSKKFFG